MLTALTRFPVNFAAAPIMPALCLYSLASSLRTAGLETVVIDTFADQSKRLLTPETYTAVDNVDVLGFSIDSINWGLSAMALEAVKRHRPDITTVVGGVHVHHFPDQVVSHPGVDYAIIGDGEQALVQLVQAICDRRDPVGIPGVLTSRNGSTLGEPPQRYHLAARPVPAFDLVPSGIYPIMPFETSRGCPGKCRFCSIDHLPYRQLSTDEIACRMSAALELAADRFTAGTIFITDDCFSASPKRAEQLCRVFSDLGLTGRIVVEVRAIDLLRSSVLIPALVDLEPFAVEIGAECGYDRGLTELNKGIVTADLVACAQKLHTAGISDKALYSFMVGLPWEDEQDCLATVDFAASLVDKHGGAASLSWFTLLPSELWTRRQAYGIDVDDDMFLLPLGGNVELFDQIHPRLRSDNLRSVEQAIDEYKARGVKLDRILLWRH